MQTNVSLDASQGAAKRGPILSIQYLRAFAAIAVVAAHADGIVLGQAGVDVFFVISGFIMWVTTSKNSNLSYFVKNRIIRIVPLYWLATILMGLHQHAGVLPVIKSMLFIPYVGQEDQIWPVLVQGWTLNYEMFFYLLIAVVLLMPKARRLPAIVTTIALLGLCGSLIGPTNAVVATYTNTLLLEFCFGIGLAELWFRQRFPSPILLVSLAVIGLILMAVFAGQDLPTRDRFVVWGIPSALVVAAALSLELSGRVARSNILLILGDASYAIYLFHTFLLKTVVNLVNGPLPGANLLAVAGVSAVVGVLITRWVEKPLLGYLRVHTRLLSAG